MPRGLYIVDFHAHLQDCQTQQSLCHDRNSLFFKHAAPLIERIGHISEPVYTEFARSVAITHRDPLTRYISQLLGNVLLVEALRLFKKYGVQRLLQSMDQNGIDHAVIHSIEPLTLTSNILAQIEPFQDRLSLFASVHREEPDPIKYFSQFVEAGLVRGLKIHPIVGGFACGELYHKCKDLISYVGDKDLPVLIHTGHIPYSGLSGCSDVDALEPLIKEFPRTKFILAHIGLESWRRVMRLARMYSNVWVETSWQPARVIRRAVDLIGPERVIFGSDFPLFNQSFALLQVRRALTAKEFVLVSSVNATRLLKLHGSQQKHRQIRAAV